VNIFRILGQNTSELCSAKWLIDSVMSAGLYLGFAMGSLCWIIGAVASPRAQCPVPLEKGMQWSYEGKVKWTVVNSGVVLATNVHWVMEVTDTAEQGAIRAAVVRGVPDELAWYEPGRVPGFCVLLMVTNHLYRIPADSEQDGLSLARKLTKDGDKLPSSAEEWLVFPLAKGQKWGGGKDREDNNYCWYVQERRRKNLKIEGYPANHPADVWTLVYRTNPDHQIVEIAQGLGITRYAYVHHGTVASVDVRLVSIRNPDQGK